MGRREKIRKLSLEDRLKLLRGGALSEIELAEAVNDFGVMTYLEAHRDVENLLAHSSPIVRFNAIATLAFEWGRASEIAIAKLGTMLREDPDEDCRAQAAMGLGSLFKGTKADKIMRLLLNVIEDRREKDEDVRAAAYLGILSTLGIPWQKQKKLLGRFTIAQDDLESLYSFIGCLSDLTP